MTHMRKIIVRNWPVFLFFEFWFFYFVSFWSRAVYFDANGNLWAGHINIWGDWAAHFTMANAMAVRGLFIQSPFLLHAHFSYPFVADYISALFLRGGFSLIQSFIYPSLFLSFLIVASLYFFYKTVFQSRRIALLASCIFLFNGGVGFYYFFRDVMNSAQPILTFLQPLHEYTRIDEEGIKWISVIDSMIIPQRSFGLGFSCAIVALAVVYRIFFSQNKVHSQKKDLLLSICVGLLLGFLPILHTHSFLASFLFLVCWSIADLFFLAPREKRSDHLLKWGIIAVVTALIALPLIHLYFLHNVSQNFFQLRLGWMASEFEQNWLLFTWKNWGITPLLSIIGLFLLFKKSKKNHLGVLFLPSFLIFTLSNLFLFQPWSWDNTKLFVWFLLGSSGLIAYLLSYFYQLKCEKIIWQYCKSVVVILLFFAVTASGIIDAYRIQLVQIHSYMMYSVSDVRLSSWVKEHTNPHSIWLTGHSHNHWLFNLTGRQAVMTYPGWLWTQGYSYLSFEEDVKVMYAGSINSNMLLEKYQVNYVVVGENERNEQFANELYFKSHFPVVYQDEQTNIYQIK